MKETIVVRRATVYIVILGIVCTGLGVAGGIAIEKRYTARNLPRIVRRQILKHPKAAQRLTTKARLAQREKLKAGAANIFKRISQELNLTSEQKDKVKAILETTKKEVKQGGDEFKVYVAQTKEKSHTQILEVLDPEQKEKFKALTAKIEERKEKTRRFRGTKWKD